MGLNFSFDWNLEQASAERVAIPVASLETTSTRNSSRDVKPYRVPDSYTLTWPPWTSERGYMQSSYVDPKKPPPCRTKICSIGAIRLALITFILRLPVFKHDTQMQFGLHEELINEAGPNNKNGHLDVVKTENTLTLTSTSMLGKKRRIPPNRQLPVPYQFVR